MRSGPGAAPHAASLFLCSHTPRRASRKGNPRMIRRYQLLLLLGIVAAGLVADVRSAGATEVWMGRTFGFSKAPGANPTLPANQDRISPLVWITRGSTMGIYNIKQEASYVHNLSPKGTE